MEILFQNVLFILVNLCVKLCCCSFTWSMKKTIHWRHHHHRMKRTLFRFLSFAFLMMHTQQENNRTINVVQFDSLFCVLLKKEARRGNDTRIGKRSSLFYRSGRWKIKKKTLEEGALGEGERIKVKRIKYSILRQRRWQKKVEGETRW